MVNEQLKTFISKMRAAGKSDTEISSELKNSGWDEADADSALGSAVPPVDQNSAQYMEEQSYKNTNPLLPNKRTQQMKGSIFRTILVLITLIFINPIGLILMFTISRWGKSVKILILILLIPLYIIFIINISKFIWRFKADRQIYNAFEFCVQQCQEKSQDSELLKQCGNDCIKSKMDPNVYQWYMQMTERYELK